MDKVTFKDISEFELKETLDGTEEIQVSPTEKVNLKDQLNKSVTENQEIIEQIIEDNTLSSLDNASNKPVSGNAVAMAIKGVNRVTDYEYSPNKFVVSNKGVIQYSSQSGVISGINVEGASRLRLLFNTSATAGGTSGMAFYDVNGNYISGVVAPNTGVSSVAEQIIDIPIGAVTASTTILMNHKDDWYGYLLYDRTTKTIPFSGKGFIGAFSTSSGSVGALKDTTNALKGRVSNFIDLGDATFIRLRYTGNDNSFKINFVFFYDKDLNGITYLQISTQDIVLPINENYKFIRLTYTLADDAFTEDFPIVIEARYNTTQPREIMYEMLTGGSERVLFTFVTRAPQNAGLNITDTNVTAPVLYGNEPIWGKCLIYLPPSYSPDGDATRVIMYMNGSGVVGQLSPSNANMPFIQYFTAQGYAVAFMPTPWGYNNDGTPRSQNEFWGTPTNYTLYTAFYKALCERFNVKREVFMYGKSHGGYQLASVPSVAGIPTLACTALSCAFFTLFNMWGYTDKQRIESMRDFSFSGLDTDDKGNITGVANVMLFNQEGAPNFGKETDYTDDRKAYILSQADKLIGLMVDSIDNVGLSTVDFINDYRNTSNQAFAELKPKKASPIPYLCYVAKDDHSIYNHTIRFQQMINGSNGYCRVRLMPSGLDNPHNAATSLAPTMEVTTKYGGTMTIPITAAEMLEFFQRYEL